MSPVLSATLKPQGCYADFVEPGLVRQRGTLVVSRHVTAFEVFLCLKVSQNCAKMASPTPDLIQDITTRFILTAPAEQLM
jgi:hypothetical protein